MRTKRKLRRALSIATLMLLTANESPSADAGVLHVPPARLTALKQGNPEISQAAIDDNVPMIRSLLAKGADINATNKAGRTPLMWAAGLGNTNALKTLIELGAKLEQQDAQGQTALMNAAEAGQVDALGLLIAAKANIEVRNRSGYTPLMYAAKDGRTGTIKLLVEKGSKLNEQNESGSTALIVAVVTGQADAVRLLVQLGADARIKTAAGLTAADYARLSVNPHLSEALEGKPSVKPATNAVPLNTVTQQAEDINTFRMAAAADVEKAVSKWYGKMASTKWTAEIQAKFENPAEKDLLRDFFAGALVWIDGSNSTVAVLYSPWSDCVLLLQMQTNGQKTVISDFAFTAGESWRGEKITTADDALKIYTSGNPIALNLARLVKATAAVFKSEYGDKKNSDIIAPALKSRIASNADEIRPPLVRLLYRQRMYTALFAADAKPLSAAANEFVKRVEAGNKSDLAAYLSPDQNKEMLEAICSLPGELRTRLCPVYFSGNPNDGVVAFVNPEHTDWAFFARVRFGNDRKADVTAELLPFRASSVLAALWGDRP